MKKTIYDLQLHETLWVDEIDANVIKVPSGWIYKYTNEVYDGNTGSYKLLVKIVFVPFDKTFHEGK
tara:strand:- start:6 stop:203 length:198 start_codon:yes stop_codon:yes gene_type:complete